MEDRAKTGEEETAFGARASEKKKIGLRSGGADDDRRPGRDAGLEVEVPAGCGRPDVNRKDEVGDETRWTRRASFFPPQRSLERS